MRSRELTKQQKELEGLFNRTSAACGSDIEMMSHWAKYLCVRSAGFIENAISEIYSEFGTNAAQEPVANYATTTLSKIQNPKTQKFIDTASHH